MNRAASQLKQKFDVAIIFCLAFTLRAVYVYNNAWLASDSLEYLTLAKNLAFHKTFSFGGDEFVPTAFRPPLYPALISLFWWSEDAPLMAVLYLQALLGALTAVLTYYLARRHFGKLVAVIAALAISIEPFTIHYAATVMTETLFTFLLVLAAYFWGSKRFISAGFVFGLATLARPSLIPFFAFLLLLSIFPAWSRYRKAFLTMALVAAATVSVWTIRNALVFSQIIPVTSSGFGMNLLCGTIDVPMLSDEGWDAVHKDSAIQKMYQDLRNGKTEAEADRDLFKEGLRRIFSNPLDWLKVRAKQYPRLFIDSAPYILGRNNVRFEDAIDNGQWFFIIYKLTLVSRIFIAVGLALIGIFLLRDRLAELGHVVLFPIFLMLIHVPLWTESRYLLPMLPFVCILAAYALGKLLELLRNQLTQRKKNRTQMNTDLADFHG